MNTHTLTPAERETVDALFSAFEFYTGPVGERWTDRHVPNLARAHRGPWFSAESLRAFGSRNLHLHRPGLLVETQTNGPSGTEWAVTAWTMNDGRTVVKHLGRFSSLRAARRFAELADAVWPVFTRAHALRAAGCPGDTDELIALVSACEVTS
jgi:hypothetical protein